MKPSLARFEVAHLDNDGLVALENVEELKPEAQAKEFSSVTPSLALQASISARFVCKRPKCATLKLTRRASFEMSPSRICTAVTAVTLEQSLFSRVRTTARQCRNSAWDAMKMRSV